MRQLCRSDVPAENSLLGSAAFHTGLVKALRFGLLFLLSGFLAGINSVGQGVSAREAILKANKQFEEAHLKGDAKAIADQYTEDGQLLWEDRPVMTGRKAIEEEWRKDMGGPGRKATITNLEIEEHGDWAFETSNFLVTDSTGRTVYDGKYICIWKRIGKEWKIYRDIGNKNTPAK